MKWSLKIGLKFRIVIWKPEFAKWNCWRDSQVSGLRLGVLVSGNHSGPCPPVSSALLQCGGDAAALLHSPGRGGPTAARPSPSSVRFPQRHQALSSPLAGPHASLHFCHAASPEFSDSNTSFTVLLMICVWVIPTKSSPTKISHVRSHSFPVWQPFLVPVFVCRVWNTNAWLVKLKANNKFYFKSKVLLKK